MGVESSELLGQHPYRHWPFLAIVESVFQPAACLSEEGDVGVAMGRPLVHNIAIQGCRPLSFHVQGGACLFHCRCVLRVSTFWHCEAKYDANAV